MVILFTALLLAHVAYILTPANQRAYVWCLVHTGSRREADMAHMFYGILQLFLVNSLSLGLAISVLTKW